MLTVIFQKLKKTIFNNYNINNGTMILIKKVVFIEMDDYSIISKLYENLNL